MIRYALACETGHEFESWFPSAASYDAQAERGLVACPVCGSAKVEKRIMAPAIGRKGLSDKSRAAEDHPGEGRAGETRPEPAPPSPAETAPQPVALMSEREVAIRAMLRAVRDEVTKNADYVGRSFAEQARRMHHGEIEHRSIYGETDPAEARALLDEGIEVHPLPTGPDDRN